MTRIVIIHHVNGATKTATFTAPVISRQMIDGGIYATLHEEQGGPIIGDAMFTQAGIVELGGVAIEQYGLALAPRR